MILVATGLLREAKLIARDGVVVIAGGGDAARLERELSALAGQASAILSIGLAGALVGGLKPGDWVVEGKVAPFIVPPGARRGRITASERPVADAIAKRALYAATGAIAVDMESGVAARVAKRHRRRFAALRVISDSVEHGLPPAALLGMRPDGAMDLPAVLRSLWRQPGQLGALIRTGWAAERAFRALGRLTTGGAK
ncbi:phosphorylase [Polymorphobacter sp. PAMC 29334]|uniref:phosphorylase family protein n=1 Tax=Polymorphobacter sp. PAMC 29334 TaxID=2862331 RepID=UPI001C74B669|nr:phosphorylase [Polymorphobacter sp. PAMC 29334]QYE34550.1 phosphorylase [Polymorphobacter sp. PAMC 29334]